MQAVFWGHPVTSGVPEAIDYYLLADAAEAAGDASAKYTEQLLRLDTLGTYYYRAPREPHASREAAQRAAPELAGVPHGARLYACAQHCGK